MLLTHEQLQERLFALHRASLELMKDISLETLLQRIAATACEQADARYAALGVLDEEGQLVQFITVGLTEEKIKQIGHTPVGHGLIGALMNTTSPIRVPSIKAHSASVGFPAHHPPMESFLGVPIRAGDKQLGQIYLTEKQGTAEFTEDDQMIIQMLATYAGTAITNARLHASSRRFAVLEERERIGMDLHDGVIQSIYGIGLSLDSAQHTLDENPQGVKNKIRDAIDGLNQTIRDIRAYILDLKPRQLGAEGLIGGIKQLVAEYRANTLSEINLVEPDVDLQDLSYAQSLVLFHICQEALANAAKHAKAKNTQVIVWATPERALLEIKDDGKGFDLNNTQTSIGHGLANMQTRAHAAHGDIEITSAPDEGTAILVWVPRKIA